MEELTLVDFFAILRRWKKVFLVTALSVLLLTLIVANSWSNYRSTAFIQIEQPEISAKATASGNGGREDMEALADQRISSIQQKVTSTASLIEIITKFDLYANARKHKPISSIVEAMRKKIKIDLISSTLANPSSAGHGTASEAIAFTLSFDYRSPLLAQQVADELATRFLDEDLKERRSETQETANFLSKQIATMETYLSDQEKRISEYQKEHGISNPNNLMFNQQASTTVLLNLQSIESQITANEGVLGALRGQLAGLDPYSRVVADGQVMSSPSIQRKSLQTQYATLSAQYGPDHPDVVKIKRQIEAIQVPRKNPSSATAQLKAQIDNTRTNLAAARSTYGDTHPDVLALQEKLKKLETQLANDKSSATIGIVADADNPAYLQAAAQLQAAEEQSKALQTQREQLMNEKEGYQKAILNSPQSTQEMAALTRDYENAQTRYRELKEKKMAADMNVDMQSDRKGQRLTLINPPELPLDTQPGHSLLLMGGLVLAVLAGLGSVVASQTLSRSVVGPHHLETIAGFAPLITIPQIMTSSERDHSLQQRLRVLYRQIRTRLDNIDWMDVLQKVKQHLHTRFVQKQPAVEQEPAQPKQGLES